MNIRSFHTTLSCITLWPRLLITFNYKKLILILMIFSFTGACTAPTAMIGPAYTLSSTGNIFQAGLSYSSNELITYYTEKTPLENLKEISQKERKKFNNIKKQTLESEDFFALIQNKINKTSKILDIANQ